MTDEPQRVPSEAEQLWSRLREQLRWTMAKETYEFLLQGSEGVELEGHSLTVEVRTPRALPWLNERLMPNLLRTAHMLADPEPQIVFAAEDEAEGRDTEPGGDRDTGPTTVGCGPTVEGARGAGDPETGENGVAGERGSRDTETRGNGDARRIQQPTRPQPLQEPGAPLDSSAIRAGGAPLSAAVPQGSGVSQSGGRPQNGGSPQQGGMPSVAHSRLHDLSDAETAITWTDVYIKLKVAFRKTMLCALRGPSLSVFLCLALHMNRDAKVCLGIEVLMRETGYGRASICAALDELESLRLISKKAKLEGADEYTLLGYAWLGKKPAPALYELGGGQGRNRQPGM